MKIVNIVPKEWNGKKFWEIELADGTKGSCWQPEFAAYSIGQEADFEVQTDARGNKRLRLKNVAPKPMGARGKSPEEIEQQKRLMVVAYAKDLTVAFVPAGEPEDSVLKTWKFFFEEGLKLVEGR